MDKKQAFARLGLGEGATERAVRRAYRSLLFELEDTRTSDVTYPQKRKELDEALEVCLRNAKPATTEIPTPVATGKEPLTHRALGLRLAGGLIGIAALIFGFQWFQEALKDPGGESKVDTQGWVAAIRSAPNGGKVVAVKPDGTIVEPTDGKGAHDDREAVWRPDGNRVLVLSNRDGTAYDVFRWDPGDGSVGRRSGDSRGKASLNYRNAREGENGPTALVTMGGLVYEYDQRDASFRQVLPPAVGRTVVQGEDSGGAVGQMDALYRQIGETFVVARWAPSHDLIYAVMRREEGEVFVVNPLNQKVNQGRPRPLMAGGKVEFDVGPNGLVAVSLLGYQFLDPADVPAEFLKDGVPTPPVSSGVFLIPPGQQPFIIAHARNRGFFLGPLRPDAKPQFTHPDREFGFAQPTVSPDGARLAVVIGTVTREGVFESTGLIVFPIAPDSREGVRQVTGGGVGDPSWSPDSQRLVFTLRAPDGRRALAVGTLDGAPPKPLSLDGDFSRPSFSPQGG